MWAIHPVTVVRRASAKVGDSDPGRLGAAVSTWVL
jgi:hypothetical protein